MATKALSFDVGDYVVYPKHGVGRVVELQSTEIAGTRLELYVLRFEKEKMTLRVPVNKADSVGMRKLSSDKTMKDALETLKGKPKVKRTMWSRRAQEYEYRHQLAKLGHPVDRREWWMFPHTVNAVNLPLQNALNFPAGILEPPFYNANADAAFNYGAIGSVIGHEIGHGFDDQGAQYDGEGNLNDWWTPADKAAFEVKSKTLVAQYDGFEPRDLPGEHVNGALTVGENIGDLGGITIALKAYLISLDGAEAPVLNGLTGEQRVFVNFAHVWRSKRRKEQLLQLLTVDPHSPGEFRANIVRNLDEFHEVFETSTEDALWVEPEQRVRIW